MSFGSWLFVQVKNGSSYLNIYVYIVWDMQIVMIQHNIRDFSSLQTNYCTCQKHL